MLTEKMLNALNGQMIREFEASFLYLSMSSYFEEKNLVGMAHWMRTQAEEEREHAFKFYDFIFERNERPRLGPLTEPKHDWGNVVEVFSDALKAEQGVTAEINSIMALAIEENDYATKVFLDWFVNEQVEEESTIGQILERIKMVQNSPEGLLFMDNELANRTPEEE